MLDRCSPRRGGDSCLRPVQSNGSPMSPQTDAERELAQLLVESLNLEEVEPGSIDPEAPLFNTGLGLDSIDAVELALAYSKRDRQSTRLKRRHSCAYRITATSWK